MKTRRLQMPPLKALLLASLAGLTLSACASEELVPVSNLKAWRPIQWKCEEVTGQTRVQVIQHNSRYASVAAGKQVAYADDCPKPAAPKAPATS